MAEQLAFFEQEKREEGAIWLQLPKSSQEEIEEVFAAIALRCVKGEKNDERDE